mmetsp:Transcript_85988/g.240413  ORF Transcript_85988/g.240413 Transcript_85988/m.240413 type:complete len:332 (-) Transcript_85988:305-1300(-)
MWNWTCDSIRADPVFQGADAQLSYSRDKQVKLSSSWETFIKPSGARKLDVQAPLSGALYFGIKDIQFADTDTPSSWRMTMLEAIRNKTHLPKYMDERNLYRKNPNGISELDSLYSSPELWLSPPSAGAQAHMDGHVSTTVSLQLTGQKQWRLSQIPPRRSVARRSEYGDGAVYRREGGWRPHYVLTLHAGDALFFPPGTIHETSNVGAECAVSITYQFSVPMPARYYRSFVTRFRRSGDLQESWALMQRWASFNGAWQRVSSKFDSPGMVTLPKVLATATSSDAAATLRDAFEFLDSDGDGLIAESDLASAIGELKKASQPRPEQTRGSDL